MINQSTDPSLHYSHSEPRSEADWRRVHNYCLKRYDYEAAALIYDRNLVSDECDSGEHEDCHFRQCTCPHHSEVQFKREHPQMQSLVHAQLRREESEAAA